MRDQLSAAALHALVLRWRVTCRSAQVCADGAAFMLLSCMLRALWTVRRCLGIAAGAGKRVPLQWEVALSSAAHLPRLGGVDLAVWRLASTSVLAIVRTLLSSRLLHKRWSMHCAADVHSSTSLLGCTAAAPDTCRDSCSRCNCFGMHCATQIWCSLWKQRPWVRSSAWLMSCAWSG